MRTYEVTRDYPVFPFDRAGANRDGLVYPIDRAVTDEEALDIVRKHYAKEDPRIVVAAAELTQVGSNTLGLSIFGES